MEYLFFYPTEWNKHDLHSFFYGYINEHGRYCPTKRFTVNRYGKRIFESTNTHNGVEFLPTEITHLIK